jgi:hypothetical protein
MKQETKALIVRASRTWLAVVLIGYGCLQTVVGVIMGDFIWFIGPPHQHSLGEIAAVTLVLIYGPSIVIAGVMSCRSSYKWLLLPVFAALVSWFVNGVVLDILYMLLRVPF